jgi:hypothetical protein
MDAGLTVFEYFVAHAPEVPSWWPAAEETPLPMLRVNYTGEKLNAWKGRGDYLDDKDIRPEWLAEFDEVVKQHRAEVAVAQAANVKAEMKRVVSWRRAYAALMCAEI